MEVPALQAEDYFTDEDYLPPRSPGLQPVKIRWYSNGIDSISGTKRGRIYDLSVDDDELDLEPPWAPAEVPTDSDHVALIRLPKPLARETGTLKSTLKLPGDASRPNARDTGAHSTPAPRLSLEQLSSLREPALVSISAGTKRKVRKRFGLPIIINGQNESVMVMACPDTGSHENIVPLALATRLGLHIDRDLLDDGDRAFALANGKVVQSLGIASLRCAFGAPGVVNSASAETAELVAHVFESLAVPAIIGAAFLEETETFTKHRNRLVEELMPAMQSLRVSAVGKPRKGLICRLDTFVGCANADTGSDLDLVSPEFVQQRGLRVKEGVEILQFADGSWGSTSGSIDVNFAIGNLNMERGFVTRGRALDVEFFILGNLTSDILVGQDTLEELNVLGQNADLFIDSLPQPGLSDCNIIRHIGTVERTARSALKALYGIFTGRNRQDSPPSSPSSVAPSVGERSPEDQLTAVQRENARIEAEANGYRYKCDHPGCSAAPFSTQYLLNAHSNVHSSARPHYCPVKGCSRSEGGRGFKRKNEMIRHGLIHESPGYICPFCPDRDHKYPRPDNLQRHVRVHHVDKDKDDPLLREVLAQSPDGPSKGRRRRGGNSFDS